MTILSVPVLDITGREVIGDVMVPDSKARDGSVWHVVIAPPKTTTADYDIPVYTSPLPTLSYVITRRNGQLFARMTDDSLRRLGLRN